MSIKRRLSRISVILFSIACSLQTIQAQENPSSSQARVVIVVPERPTDSVGETVYRYRGNNDTNEAAVQGILSPPRITAVGSDLEIAKFVRKSSFRGVVTIQGVVTAKGKYIDIGVLKSPDPEVAKVAIKTASEYKFAPATLDGKPVATLLNLEIKFADAPPQRP